MKKTRMFTAVLCAFLLCACGSSAVPSSAAESGTGDAAPAQETAEPESEYCDEAFLADFSEAIQARWAISAAHEKESASDNSTAGILKCVNAEKAIIEPKDYRHQTFKDNHLYEDAIVYLNALDAQEEVLKSYTEFIFSDEDSEKYNSANSRRYEIVVDLYDNYDLKIDSKYIRYVNKTHNDVWINKYGTDAFWQMINSPEIEEGTDSDNNYLATFRITNQTDYTFKDIGIQGIVYTVANDEVDKEEEFFDKEFASWEPGEALELTLNGLQLIEYGMDGKDIEVVFFDY